MVSCVFLLMIKNEFGTGGGPILDCDIDNDVEVPEVWFGLSDDQW